MEGNRDEALKCIQIAKSLIERNENREKAIKMLEKSNRMVPNEEAKSLLKQLLKQSDSGSRVDTSSSAPQEEKTKTETSTQARHTEPLYTQEQQMACKRILSEKNYYVIMGVNDRAPDELIKKSYKKLALTFHPDKNKAPGAEDAFKKISRAFQCLTDPKKRAIYDQCGDDEEVSENMRQQYEAEFMSAEELFSRFFGFDMEGEVRGQRIYRRPTRVQTQGNLFSVYQIIPVLIIILFSIITNNISLGPKAEWSLHPTSYHKTLRNIPQFSINYYVSSEFDKKFKVNSREPQDVSSYILILNMYI
eukprot:GHVL01036152.1.p1 GENE.GHVL01036152.1~~GHVL01036152.1.p1  ORF type:complete len:305 (-),score=38.66 GHVL01036152.1:90-1004(-)